MKIFFNIGEFQTFDYDYSTRQMISRSYAIAKLSLSEILQTHPDVFFVIYNGLNDFCRVLLRRYQEVNDLTVDNLKKLDEISQTFLWVSLVCMLLFCLVLSFMLFRNVIDKVFSIKRFFFYLLFSIFNPIEEADAAFFGDS